LLVLLVMITLRGLNNRNQRDALNQTNTAVMLTLEIRQTEDARPTVTHSSSETATPEPTTTVPISTNTPLTTPTEVIQPTSEEGCDTAVFLLDVTVPDKTKFNPDTKFTKTWRLLNDGTCTWTTKYKLYFYSGEIMSGPESQRLTSVSVPPGKSIDVSVVLRAPLETGTYKGFWALKNEGGVHFGLGPFNNPFYVEIVVGLPDPTFTPVP
ncbi:MAG: NBR1-Ig-like domain-containing protein, partial [Anaerolineales bacterium]